MCCRLCAVHRRGSAPARVNLYTILYRQPLATEERKVTGFYSDFQRTTKHFPLDTVYTHTSDLRFEINDFNTRGIIFIRTEYCVL